MSRIDVYLELESSYWKFRLAPLVVFIICHSFHIHTKKEAWISFSLTTDPCFYTENYVAKRPSLLWQEAHKIALKNLAWEEEQFSRHHLNRAYDFIYALFFQILRPVRQISAQWRFTYSHHLTLESVIPPWILWLQK